jgi:Ran GTPase-activating protein (RanGAP) involved in mRNA processing and transport
LKDNKVILSIKFSISFSFTILDNNGFGREGTKCIASILDADQNLKSFNLSDNAIYTEGAIYISKAMKKNKNIISLELSTITTTP